MSSKRYFSVPLARSADVAPDDEGISNVEEAGGEKINFVDDSLTTTTATTKDEKRKHFPSKKRRFFHANDDDQGEEGDPFGGPVPVDEEKVKKYQRGGKFNLKGIRTGFYKEKFKQQRNRNEDRAKQAARAELLLPEDAGFIEPDEDEVTYRLSQREIVDSVDILSATKHFELNLASFGPYRCDYTKNGRHLLLGGRKGHVAAIDWLTKDLICEVNVMESVRDVKWLHNEMMFAVAQKKWTYLYDRNGVELHCLKSLYQTRRLEFLPYHFLLVSATSISFLHWLDVSMGKVIRTTPTKQGPLDAMCTNPSNAIVHVGSSKGTVSLWSPNVSEPLVKMLCHGSPVRGLTVDNSGTYMATSGADQLMRIWDLRTYKNLHTYKLPRVAEPLAFSQRRLLAAGVGTQAEIFRDPCSAPIVQPYLIHDCREMITGLRFCPYEDVLGVGHRAGFVSVLAPGAGEPNVDAYEANPYQTKKQRRETEVRQLLDKIQPEMITLEADLIGRVDSTGMERKMDEKMKFLRRKPSRNDVQVKHKMKGKGGTAAKEHRKQAVKEQKQRDFLQQRKTIHRELVEEGALPDDESSKRTKDDPSEPRSALDRFKRKA